MTHVKKIGANIAARASIPENLIKGAGWAATTTREKYYYDLVQFKYLMGMSGANPDRGYSYNLLGRKISDPELTEKLEMNLWPQSVKDFFVYIENSQKKKDRTLKFFVM